MGVGVSMAIGGAEIASAGSGLCRPREPQRWSKRREKPFVIFGPEHFVGVQHRKSIGVPDSPVTDQSITVKVWRDKVLVERRRSDETPIVRLFRSDPPTGLRNKTARLRIGDIGLAWDTDEHITVTVLWHPTSKQRILSALRPVVDTSQRL
jgi:hypothetical protein